MLKGPRLVFLTKLYFLSKKSGYCFAKNRAFVNDPELGVDERTIQRWTAFLRKNGFIEVQIVNNNDRRIFLTNAGLQALPERVTQSQPWQNVTPDNLERISVSPPAFSPGSSRQNVTPLKVPKHKTNSTYSKNSDEIISILENKISQNSHEMIRNFLEGGSESLPGYLMELIKQHGYIEPEEKMRTVNHA